MNRNDSDHFLEHRTQKYYILAAFIFDNDWRKSMNDSFGQVTIDGLSVNAADVLRNVSGKIW